MFYSSCPKPNYLYNLLFVYTDLYKKPGFKSIIEYATYIGILMATFYSIILLWRKVKKALPIFPYVMSTLLFLFLIPAVFGLFIGENGILNFKWIKAILCAHFIHIIWNMVISVKNLTISVLYNRWCSKLRNYMDFLWSTCIYFGVLFLTSTFIYNLECLRSGETSVLMSDEGYDEEEEDDELVVGSGDLLLTTN